MTEVFNIVPARSSAGLIAIAGILLVTMVGVGLLVYSSMRGARNARFEVSDQGLRLRGDMYGRLIPPRDLRAAEARIVDLQRERDLRPRLRIFGTSVGSYRAGMFRLASGERSLLYVTDDRRVVYVPTRRDHSVMLSVDRPDQFIDALRRIAPGN
jgi:hypothetical protein